MFRCVQGARVLRAFWDVEGIVEAEGKVAQGLRSLGFRGFCLGLGVYVGFRV